MRLTRSAAAAVLASVCLAASLAGCQLGEGGQETSSELVIGADLELSGARASSGKAYQRALELKVRQINESGALGQRKLRLDVKDNKSDPDQSLRNINDFTADSGVAALIMGSCDACAIGAAKTVNDRRMPTIALATASKVANPISDRRYMFKLGPNAADTAAALAVELRRKEIDKVGLLRTDDEYGQEGEAALASELSKLRIRITAVQQVKPTDTDMSQAVRLLNKKKPDALIVWTSAEQSVVAADNAKTAGFKGQLFFDAGAAGELFLPEASTRSTDNATLVFTETMVIDDVIATTPAKVARKQWFRNYTSRYGSYNGNTSFAADALQLIVNALTHRSGADEINRDQLRDVLETSQLDGLSGLIRITPSNHSGLMPQSLTMLVARGGRWRLAG